MKFVERIEQGWKITHSRPRKFPLLFLFAAFVGRVPAAPMANFMGIVK